MKWKLEHTASRRPLRKREGCLGECALSRVNPCCDVDTGPPPPYWLWLLLSRFGLPLVSAGRLVFLAQTRAQSSLLCLCSFLRPLSCRITKQTSNSTDRNYPRGELSPQLTSRGSVILHTLTNPSQRHKLPCLYRTNLTFSNTSLLKQLGFLCQHFLCADDDHII